MTVWSLTWPVAATLLAGDLPADVRRARLAPYFSPSPGQELRVEQRALRDLAKTGKLRAERLRGSVLVTPPKGICFTITRALDTEDEIICKRQALSFTVDELDEAGRVVWEVRTGDGDFGTTLTWPTPYRRALLLPHSRRESHFVQAKTIERCEAERATGRRRIKVTMLTGETIVIRFGDRDELFPLQPPPTSPLVDAGPGAKQAEKSAEAKAAHENTESSPHKKDGEPAAPEPAPEPPKEIPESEDRREWAIGRRGAYVLSVDNLLIQGSPTPGLKGQCRYHYRGPQDDPETGRIECHDADGYQLVYLPLTCLKDIGPAPQDSDLTSPP